MHLDRQTVLRVQPCQTQHFMQTQPRSQDLLRILLNHLKQIFARHVQDRRLSVRVSRYLPPRPVRLVFTTGLRNVVCSPDRVIRQTAKNQRFHLIAFLSCDMRVINDRYPGISSDALIQILPMMVQPDGSSHSPAFCLTPETKRELYRRCSEQQSFGLLFTRASEFLEDLQGS